MVSLFKSLQSILSGIFADLPDGVKILTEFVWRCRWFIVGGFVAVGVYNAVMVALPYFLWTMAIKLVVGSVFSLL
jgi:uncharacterized membrane protein YiaA